MWNSAYLQKESFNEDLQIDLENADDAKGSANPFRGMVKYYA